MAEEHKYLMKKYQNVDKDIKNIVIHYDKMSWGPYFIIKDMIKVYLRLERDTKNKNSKMMYKQYIKALKKIMNNILKTDVEFDL